MPGMKPTMHEFRKGQFHSGSKTGPVVTSRKQAIAIALSEQDQEDAKEHGQRKALRSMGKH